MASTMSRVSHRTCSYKATATPQRSAGLLELVNSLQIPPQHLASITRTSDRDLAPLAQATLLA